MEKKDQVHESKYFTESELAKELHSLDISVKHDSFLYNNLHKVLIQLQGKTLVDSNKGNYHV